MSPVLPFDITSQIIDIVGENGNESLLKSLALVSPSFHQISSKYLFADIELYDAKRHIRSSKKGFVKLLNSRPEVIKYIRKLTYHLSEKNFNNADHLVSPILSNFLPTISCLNYLRITNISTHTLTMDWNKLDPSLTSGLLHLMHLPTIDHIDLSFFQNFPLSSLTSSVNLHRLDILCLTHFDPHEEDGSFEIVQSEMAPKIREFHTSMSFPLTTKLLHIKMQNGGPAFNFTDLRRLSMEFEDTSNLRYILQNAELLESLHISIERGSVGGLFEFHDILSLSASTLKILDLTVFLHMFEDLCEELEAMAGHNILESLSFEVVIDDLETEDFIGSILQKVEKVVVQPGWSALREFSIKVNISCGSKEFRANLSEALQSLPDKYLSHISKLESVAFNYSVVRQYSG